MFKPIHNSDITIRPFKVYKTRLFTSGSTYTESTIPISAIRNLDGSFEDHEEDQIPIAFNSSSFYNEYSLNKSIRTIYYDSYPKLVATVTNWDRNRHYARKQKIYNVSGSIGEVQFLSYYDYSTNEYINEFDIFLETNKYFVDAFGSVLKGRYPDITKIYGKVNSFGSVTERLIEDRFLLINIPQKYIGEEIKPGSFSITELSGGRKLTDDANGGLIYLNEIVGNIFYGNGIVTITKKATSPSDENYNFGNGGYIIEFQSTKTIYENEIFIEIEPNEFNTSTNPTAVTYKNGATYINNYIEIDPTEENPELRGYDFRIPSQYQLMAGSTLNDASKIGFNEYEEKISNDPTGSYLAPYITTIGLYDDEYNLVAVAKIPSKPKSLPDYPVNFVVRFDT